tara:strand:- start:12599 stop:13156 length:558 start_codon:yes stop_codon:yes gene_type:complete
LLISSLFVSLSAAADEVILENTSIQNSLCVGVTCIDGEDFQMDTVRLKADAPQIVFQDTSNSGAFPSTDWRLGVSDDNTGAAPSFFIENVDSAENVLEITADGDVALGVGAVAESGAVSVGAEGEERRVTFVADGTEDTDAVNLRQFNAYKETINTEAVDAQVAELQSRIDALTARIEALAAQGN